MTGVLSIKYWGNVKIRCKIILTVSKTRPDTRNTMRLVGGRSLKVVTDGRTDGLRDIPSYRDALSHLKKIKGGGETFRGFDIQRINLN